MREPATASRVGYTLIGIWSPIRLQKIHFVGRHLGGSGKSQMIIARDDAFLCR